MNCPYCNKEMELGIIQSPQEINWKKGTKKKIIGASWLHKDSVVLSEFAFNGSAVIAHLCRQCEKVIIDYSDNNGDLNESETP